MSQCENIDGQCGASWCDCDYQRRKRDGSFAAPAGYDAFLDALLEVERGLKTLEAVCIGDALRNETRTIREAFEQRRFALVALRHNHDYPTSG